MFGKVVMISTKDKLSANTKKKEEGNNKNIRNTVLLTTLLSFILIMINIYTESWK